MTTTYQAPQSLLSIGARIATALAVVACVATAWAASEHESQRAVNMAATAINGPVYVTLPTVEVIGQRLKSGDAVAASQAGATAL